MKKFYFSAIALLLSISSVQAGLPPEFAEPNDDGIMISYGKAGDWFDNYEGDDLMVACHESGEKYTGEITIPETVVHNGITYSVIGIAPWVFEEGFSAENLTSISIPASVYYINSYAFYNSTLKDIYVAWSDPADVTVDPSDGFDNLAASNVTLHVPAGSKTLYEAIKVWQGFKIADDVTPIDVNSVAKLSAITISAGALSPGFKSSQYAYAVTVPQSVANITLTATPAYGGTVSGDGQKVLNSGENNFSLVVTSADGTQQKTYTVKVIRLEVDIVLELISGVNETGNFYFTDALGSRLYIQDRRNLTYRLQTGNTSGSIPLNFAVGDKMLDKAVTLLPNYIYEMKVRIWVSKNGMYCSTHMDAYGRPSWSEIVCPNSTTSTVIISNNGQTLFSSATALLGPPESIEFLGLEAKGASSITEASVESAYPVGYYSITGQQLNSEPESGMYIIKYDNGKAKKVVKTR